MEPVEAAYRQEYGQVVASLIKLTGDWELAEDCAQDALASAIERWPRDGVPAKTRRVADDGRPQPGDRPAPSGGGRQGQAAAAAGRSIRPAYDRTRSATTGSS